MPKVLRARCSELLTSCFTTLTLFFPPMILLQPLQMTLYHSLMTSSQPFWIEFFSRAQSGFRKGHSTTTCMIRFLSEIYDSMEKGVVSGVLFLDLKKAFDSVSHDILLHKLKYAGLTESSITWFNSYLSNRMQVTKINQSMSSSTPVKFGVPQGSKLGPLLFIIYSKTCPSDHLYITESSLLRPS